MRESGFYAKAGMLCFVLGVSYYVCLKVLAYAAGYTVPF